MECHNLRKLSKTVILQTKTGTRSLDIKLFVKVPNLETIFMVLLTTDFDSLTTQINLSSMNDLLLKNVMHGV